MVETGLNIPSVASERLRLAEFLPYRLSVLSNTISTAIAQMYQREFGLTIWQWRVMAVVGETPEITAGDVCQRTAMDKVAVSRAVAGLVKDGHLARRADEKDGRVTRLSLTPRGAVIYDDIVPRARAYETQLLATLDPGDLEALSALLDKLSRAAESPDSQTP